MEKFEFEGSQGFKLAARLDKPQGEIRSYALFAHCFTCTKDILAASRIAKTLTEHGVAVVRFDFTGLGASDGDFANTNFTSNIEDLIKAADHMRQNYEAPSLLIGHSLGGAAILVASHNIPECKAVVTIGAPADSSHVALSFKDKHNEIEENGEAQVCLTGRPFNIKKQFLDDIKNQKLLTHITTLNRALLVLHAPLDQVVGIKNAGQIFGAAKHPKSYISLDDADHLLTRAQDAKYAADIIAKWAERYIYG